MINGLRKPLQFHQCLLNFLKDPDVNFGYADPFDIKSGPLIQSLKIFNTAHLTNRIQLYGLLQIFEVLNEKETMNKYFGDLYEKSGFDGTMKKLYRLIPFLVQDVHFIYYSDQMNTVEEMEKETELIKRNIKIYKKNPEVRIKIYPNCGIGNIKTCEIFELDFERMAREEEEMQRQIIKRKMELADRKINRKMELAERKNRAIQLRLERQGRREAILGRY